MNNKTLTVSLLVAGLFLAALIARSGDLAWLALLFLAYIAVGIFQYPVREKVRLEAERQVSRTNGEGGRGCVLGGSTGVRAQRGGQSRPGGAARCAC